MPRHLATIQPITDIQPIEGADNIEVATINNGWKVVVNKNIHKVGEKVVYFEIDSLLPPKEWNEFLNRASNIKTTVFEGKEYTGYRLRSIKLKGQISQGLVMPLSIVDGRDYEVGLDVSEFLGVVKYEAPIPAELAGDIEGPFPSFLVKTDEERVQNIWNYISTTYKNTKFSVVEKLDGTSMSVYFVDDKFGVCGRNWEFKSTTNNSLTRKAKELGLEDIMKRITDEEMDIRGIVIQGELIGEGIQGNKYKIKGQEFRIFNAYYIDSITSRKNILEPDMLSLCCEEYSLKLCPQIASNFILPNILDELLEYAEDKSKLADTTREGIVIRPLIPIFDKELGTYLSFKVISNKFLLKHDE